MTPPLLLVRHASAGDRSRWVGPDDRRPLDERGHRQAAELIEMLAPYEVGRILTSPYLRCTETVDPLAAHLGFEAEFTDALAEGSHGRSLDAFLTELRGTAAVLCSHGDVIGEIVGHGRKYKKGSVWVLEWDGDRIEPGDYLKPRG